MCSCSVDFPKCDDYPTFAENARFDASSGCSIPAVPIVPKESIVGVAQGERAD